MKFELYKNIYKDEKYKKKNLYTKQNQLRTNKKKSRSILR